MAFSLTSSLKDEYQFLFDSCIIRPEKSTEIESTVGRIVQHRDRYLEIETELNIPWYFVGVIHCMEASMNFNTHLHNGDPLTARTVNFPPGRPRKGSPPFSWKVSAIDALTGEGLHKWTDWSLSGLLFRLEGYNGFGYRLKHPEVLSPYLWSFTSHYTKGKFVSDGTFSPTAVSKQCGAAALLRRMAETGAIQFDRNGLPLPGTTEETSSEEIEQFLPLVRFSMTEESPLAAELQRALNRFPGIFVKVDGIPGRRTSDAFKKVTGHFLLGDPRA